MTESNTKTAEAERIVNYYALGAAAVGLLPFPWIDLVALTGVQLKMLHSLANLYEVEFHQNLGKSAISSLLGGGAPVSFSAHLGSAIKSVPLYGTMMGAVSTVLLGGASTYAIGKVFIQHFESGNTFLTFDPQQVRGYYEEQLKKKCADPKTSSYIGVKP